MKRLLLFIVTIFLTFNVKAQRSAVGSYDKFPHFTDNKGDFNSYLASHIKAPATISNDIKTTVAVTIQIDSTGKASVLNITPKTSSEIETGFLNAVNASPNWKPATLKGKAVNYFFTSSFDVVLSKTLTSLNVEVHSTIISSGDPLGPVYAAVQINPSFPGGEQGFGKFLGDNIRYPSEAKRKNVTGRAFVQFIVETDGSLSNFTVPRDPGEGLGDEAVRVLKLSPNWKPGMQNGKPVRVQYTVPINFSLR